ncbi:MAG TPA: RNA-binding protein [Ktedonobacterales bacterium]
MCTRLYIGNLPFAVHEDHLRRLFSIVGEVAHVEVLRDPTTRRSRGYGFVEMPDRAEAEHAIEVLDEALIGVTPIQVCKTHPPAPSSQRQDPRSSSSMV